MNMATAIARSIGNKAETYSDTGQPVVVQARYRGAESWLDTEHTNWWYHVWEVARDKVREADIPYGQAAKLQAMCHVDPDADYWHSL